MPDDDGQAGQPGLERTLTLTDGVVAIAMTLLVLPLVELVPEAERDGFSGFLEQHFSDLLGFVLSFLVIYRFWTIHDEAFASLGQASHTIRSLNMAWLLGIAFLPFPTAVVGRHASNGSAFFYLLTLFVLSALTTLITQLAAVARHRADGAERPRLVRLWVSTGVFALCAAISLVNADAGLYGLLLLLAVRVVTQLGSRRGARARRA